jgi:hypothetical protein
MRRSNFALRLQPALLDEARKLAASKGGALNQLINVAVAEKVLRVTHGGILRGTRASSQPCQDRADSETGREEKPSGGRG